jgi:phospholipid/cholesterol/gamma-HCH transport system substrate-binding protein
MNDRVVQFRVGVVVLATAIIAAILIVLFGDTGSFWKSHKTIHIKFPSAPGITVDSPVRKSGILIGRVSDVEFAPDGQILVTVEVNSDVKLFRTDRARIRTSLLGDATLEFVPGKAPDNETPPEEAKQAGEPLSRRDPNIRPVVALAAQKEEPAEPPPIALAQAEPAEIQEGETIQGEVVPSPTEIMVRLEDKIAQAADSLSVASRRVARLAGRITNFMEANDAQFARILDKSEVALDGFNRTIAGFDEFLGDEQFRANLRRSLVELPEVLAQTRQAMVELQETTALADENLNNLRGFTGPLGERGDELVLKLESGVTNLDELLAQLAAFSRALNDNEGSLGQLLNNPDLYQNLNRAALNIQHATRQLQPIIHDVRVFTDKIARDPGRLGVSGALRKTPPIK